MYCYLYIPYSVLTTKNISICHPTVDTLYPFSQPSSYPFPSGTHYSVLYIYMIIFVWFVHLFFVWFYIPLMSETILYLSFSVSLILLSIIYSRSTDVSIFFHFIVLKKKKNYPLIFSMLFKCCTGE